MATASPDDDGDVVMEELLPPPLPSNSSNNNYATAFPASSTTTKPSCQVRVGVRVRPLTPREEGEGGNCVLHTALSAKNEIRLGRQRFTFDHVFDNAMSQNDLYQVVSQPLLASFLEGYNATILAYGQTGSGKTFTMGSEAAQLLDHTNSNNDNVTDGSTGTMPSSSSSSIRVGDSTGLIPRFMNDLFAALQDQQQQAANTNNTTTAASSSLKDDSSATTTTTTRSHSTVHTSFLEVYGEDVHDLLHPDRPCLPLREDANGGVVCQGLTLQEVTCSQEALHVLQQGTWNRTTAATWMNLTSSRSHAVFCVHLTTTTTTTTTAADNNSSTSNGGGTNGVSSSSSTTTTSSRFTFVDLAGSERLKKTGAEGERAREGIKINEGLLALGNVINALAFHKKHVPYRQSKLTRLLQDALGGNSQTFFVACVSPSDTNASETLSTLHYANRAREIQNAPTRNHLDNNNNRDDYNNNNNEQQLQAVLQVQVRMQGIIRVLEQELVQHKFYGGGDAEKANVSNWQNQPDIVAYLSQLYAQADLLQQQQQTSTTTTTAKPSSSIYSSVFAASHPPNNNIVACSAAFQQALESHQATSSAMMMNVESALHYQNNNSNNNNNKSMMDPDLLTTLNPDEEMAILDQLLELQHRDQEFDAHQKRELEKVDGELAEQQGLLEKLRHSLQTYHELKTKYELVMVELQQLEKEKAQLADQLVKATADPSKGCSQSIRRELERVELALTRARNESRQQRELYRKAEQEAKKCGALERKVAELKASRAKLQRQQQQATAKHREYTETKTREILALKRKEKQSEHQVSKLQKEIAVQKRNLDKRQEYCTKLTGKLKQTEAHLMKLLSMRRRQTVTNRSNRRGAASRSSSNTRTTVATTAGTGATTNNNSSDLSKTLPPSSNSCSQEEIESFQYLVDQFVATKLEQAQIKARYEERVVDYSCAMRDLVAAIKALEETHHDHESKQQQQHQQGSLGVVIDEDGSSSLSSSSSATTAEMEQTIEGLELKVELYGEELEMLRAQMGGSGPGGGGSVEDDDSEDDEDDADLERLLADKETSMLKSVLKETIDSLIAAQLRSQKLDRSHKRIESVRHGLEDEVETLTTKLASVSKELSRVQQQQTSLGGEVAAVEQLEAEKIILSESLVRVQGELVTLQLSAEDLLKKQRILETDLAEAREKLTLRVAAERQEKEGSQAADEVLDSIQAIWKELGMTTTTAALREEVRRQIENSLEDTCACKLKETQELKAKTVLDLQALQQEIAIVRAQLGVQGDCYPDSSQPLLHQLDELRVVREGLEPTFVAAKSKAEAILKQMRDIASMIGLDHTEFPDDLCRLEGDGRDTTAGSLSEELLRRCERHLSALRLKKSELLARNATLIKETHILVVEMNLRQDQILPLIAHSMKKRNVAQPDWWDESCATGIASTLSIPGGVARVVPAFSKHLSLISDSLQSVAKGRRSLSDSLRDLVERAQKTLLATVEGEVDASEAYATFHDALFRLPALSKERIHACVAEVDAMLAGVEAMTESEIEALSVVWEAMDVSMSDRGRFWGEIEESMKTTEANPVGPFDNVVQICIIDGEEWVLNAVRDATKPYRHLEARLFKLERIHQEVERLRSQQDAKSKIISLDSEVRILSTKLAEFEDKKCNKQRLLTKKSNSAHLLKEERFRKQMQQKFSSKLEQLAKLLKTWRDDQQYDFDPNLLSEGVRVLLKNPDDMDNWVEKRTEFMHLRTVKSSSNRPPLSSSSSARGDGTPVLSTTRKRLHASDSSGSGGISEIEKLRFLTSSPTRPTISRQNKKRKTDTPVRAGSSSSSVRPVAVTGTSTTSARPPKPQPLGASSRNPSTTLSSSSSRPPSPALTTVPTKRLTLPPFGHVLEESLTPRNNNRNNENSFGED